MVGVGESGQSQFSAIICNMKEISKYYAQRCNALRLNTRNSNTIFRFKKENHYKFKKHTLNVLLVQNKPNTLC